MARDRGPILIVDDDRRCRALISKLLRRVGYATYEARTGEKALEAAERERPALVILDVLLPGASGYEICRELRENFGHELPIVFISGDRTEAADRVAGLLLGADDYIVKPFAPDELVARVRRLVPRSSPVPAAAGLTRREWEILSLLVDGLSQREIASKLIISPKTVGKHIEHILAKLNVRSRTHAVAIAAREDGLPGISASEPALHVPERRSSPPE